MTGSKKVQGRTCLIKSKFLLFGMMYFNLPLSLEAQIARGWDSNIYQADNPLMRSLTHM